METDEVTGFQVQDLKAYAITTTAWCLLYAISLYLPVPLKDRYRKMSVADELDLRNRQISFIHGLSVLVLSTYAMVFMEGGCLSPNTFFDNAVMYSSMGYFTYDFLAMAYYGEFFLAFIRSSYILLR